MQLHTHYFLCYCPPSPPPSRPGRAPCAGLSAVSKWLECETYTGLLKGRPVPSAFSSPSSSTVCVWRVRVCGGRVDVCVWWACVRMAYVCSASGVQSPDLICPGQCLSGVQYSMSMPMHAYGHIRCSASLTYTLPACYLTCPGSKLGACNHLPSAPRRSHRL